MDPKTSPALRHYWFEAVRSGPPEHVQEFIDAGVDVDRTDAMSQTAIHCAAGRGGADVLDLLLRAGANIEARTVHGLTPLMSAAFMGSQACVRRLIEAGADLEARDNGGWTAAMRAADQGRLDCLRELCLAGCDIEARGNQGESAKLLADRQCREFLREEKGRRRAMGEACEIDEAARPAEPKPRKAL